MNPVFRRCGTWSWMLSRLGFATMSVVNWLKGKERKGKERKGKERKGKERKGKERKGKERKGKERKGTELMRLNFFAIINDALAPAKAEAIYFREILLQ